MALSDLIVLDLTIARSGPVAVRQFADWGADIIRVDSPHGNDLVDAKDADYINLHRNKRSIRIDLKDSRGLATFFRLAERADVLVENFRPQVKHSLGIDYAEIAGRNPRIVYGSISGFGQDGPYAEKGGVDQIVQGMGGLMAVTGHPGQGPLRAGTAIADLAAGYHLAFGLLAALHERERSGVGQWVCVSLLESMIAMMDFQAVRWTADHDLPQPVGNDHPNYVPMGAFQTVDGYINIGASSDRLFARLCEALDDPDLGRDARFVSRHARLAHRAELNSWITRITRQLSNAELWRRLDAAGIPAGPIYTLDETFRDAQVEHLKMTAGVHHPIRGTVEILRQPVTLSRTPAQVREPSPMPGAHSREILGESGFSVAEVDELFAAGVVSLPDPHHWSRTKGQRIRTERRPRCRPLSSLLGVTTADGAMCGWRACFEPMAMRSIRRLSLASESDRIC
jgi:crotonobetainyl-CoA:carnitine CoA-transferase CaiB-like acyl-CoA transferase